MEEKRGFGSLSSPDPMVSAWTGSKQSFIDFDNDLLYLEPSDSASRADLLRCRFDLKLQDSATTALSWRPFGHIEKSLVELELWPQLETNYTRRYNAFVWYPRKNFSVLDEGFRKDTGQHIINVPDNLKMHISTDYSEKKYYVTNMRPSKDSTSKMMGFLVEGVGGGRNWAILGFSSQPPLYPAHRASAKRRLDQIRNHLESEGIRPGRVKLVSLTYDHSTSEKSKDRLLVAFFAFAGLSITLDEDIDFEDPTRRDDIRASFDNFADYLFDNFFLPLKASTKKKHPSLHRHLIQPL